MKRESKIRLETSVLSRISAVVFASVLVAGCSSSNFQDLEQYVEDTRSSQVGRIEPLPQFKPFDTYAYSSTELRDPFTPWRDERAQEQQQVNGNGIHPDVNRRKEQLESFPLDALRMVGTLAQDDGHWAIIQAPDSLVYRVKEGNYLGQNHGKIIVLAEDKIEVTELVPDGLGGWLERQAVLTLVE